MFRYSVYGLILESNTPITGVTESRSTQLTDIQLWYGDPVFPSKSTCTPARIRYTRFQETTPSCPSLIVWELAGIPFFRILYGDGTEFFISKAGHKIWASWPNSLTPEDTATYLLGPVLGFSLRLRGKVALHASAVAIKQQAIVLFGEAGAGKSTTAAAFAMRGYPVLSEDVVPLTPQNQSFLVQPGYPLIRLWPESVNLLFGSPDALPLLTPNWDKRYLDLTKNGYQFQQEPLPLGAIYILGERRDDPGAPFVEPIPPQEALIKLVSNTYTNYLLDNAARALEFEVLGQMMKRVPVRRVIPHNDPARLPDLCDVILADFHDLTTAVAAG